MSIPMWLESAGLKTSTADISFDELADLLIEVAGALDEMKNPQEMLANRGS